MKDRVFASNEVLDDIKTTLLRYALVPAYLGDLLGIRPSGPNESRVAALKKGTSFAKQFLNRCEQWGVMSPEDRATFERLGEKDAKPLDAFAARE